MLDNDVKNKNRLDFMTILSKLNVDITYFYQYLCEIDYFEKPATVQCFRSYPGGLCKYALDLYFELTSLCNAYFPGKYSEETIIKVALLKDLYRAELYEQYKRNVKNELTGQWEVQLAYKTKDATQRQIFGDIGFSSYMIAKKYFDFSDEEIEAVCNSDISNKIDNLHEIYRKYPLVTLTKMANLAAGYLETDL